MIGREGMVKRYRIIYKQKFMGKILQDSYIKTVTNNWELQSAISALYEDPHVFEVTYEEVV